MLSDLIIGDRWKFFCMLDILVKYATITVVWICEKLKVGQFAYEFLVNFSIFSGMIFNSKWRNGTLLANNVAWQIGKGFHIDEKF